MLVYITSLIVFFLFIASANEEGSSLKVQMWESYKASVKDIPFQYCMLWCDGSPSYDDPYHNDERLHVGSRKAQRIFNRYCCRVCTRDCFDTLHDTLEPLSPLEEHTEITWVTFGTIDRLDAFVHAAGLWEGPKILLLYFSDYNDKFASIPSSDEELQIARRKIAFLKNSLILCYTARLPSDPGILNEDNTVNQNNGDFVLQFPLIPTNTLRNIVIDTARTRKVFPVDLDFIPSKRLYGSLKRHSSEFIDGLYKNALVVLHWEFRPCSRSLDLNYPTDLNTLKSLLTYRLIRPFHTSLSRCKFNLVSRPSPVKNCNSLEDGKSGGNARGVRMSQYEQWINGSTEPFLLNTHHNSYEIWEPYVLISRVSNAGPIPRYCELFTGRTRNKVSFISSLLSAGYSFYSVPSEFLFHRDHPLSVYRYLQEESQRREMIFLYNLLQIEWESQTQTFNESSLNSLSTFHSPDPFLFSHSDNDMLLLLVPFIIFNLIFFIWMSRFTKFKPFQRFFSKLPAET